MNQKLAVVSMECPGDFGFITVHLYHPEHILTRRGRRSHAAGPHASGGLVAPNPGPDQWTLKQLFEQGYGVLRYGGVHYDVVESEQQRQRRQRVQ